MLSLVFAHLNVIKRVILANFSDFVINGKWYTLLRVC